MSEENDRILEILCDFADALESACVQLKHSIAELKKTGKETKVELEP